VKAPGVYKIAANAKLSDLIGYAGGTLPEARLSDIRFVHDLSIDSTQTRPVATVDYDAYLKARSPSGNPLMYPNDTIVISIEN
jgi:protein involved in polysaccharide export with SLBB domain